MKNGILYLEDPLDPVFTLDNYSKTCVKRPLSNRPKIGFKDQLLLNAGQKYCRMLQSILQYFRPSLSYHLLLRSVFCLFMSGMFYTGFTLVANTLFFDNICE